MKKLFFTLTAFLLLFAASTQAQNKFEGKVVFETKYMGEGVDQFAAFMPSGMTYYFKGSDLRLEMNGGMAAAMMGAILVKGDEGVSYMLKESEMVAYKIKKEDGEDDEEMEAKPTITKEDEVITIQGHKCQKYKVVMVTEGNEVTQYLWVAEDIKVKKPKGAKDTGNTILIEGIDGLPLKKMTTMDMMGMSFTSVETCVKLDTGKQDKSLFEVPSNYKVEDFDPSMFGGMGN
ncbi:MAG: DUF4412 domain-containing protein [Bacteroidia bacterium]|nr:DUF4412 domain-containing protein [Bacteroidia bacterium]